MPSKLGRFGKFGFYRKVFRKSPTSARYSKAAVARSVKGSVQRISQDQVTRVLCANGTASVTVAEGAVVSGTAGTIPLILQPLKLLYDQHQSSLFSNYQFWRMNSFKLTVELAGRSFTYTSLMGDTVVGMVDESTVYGTTTGHYFSTIFQQVQMQHMTLQSQGDSIPRMSFYGKALKINGFIDTQAQPFATVNVGSNSYCPAVELYLVMNAAAAASQSTYLNYYLNASVTLKGLTL